MDAALAATELPGPITSVSVQGLYVTHDAALGASAITVTYTLLKNGAATDQVLHFLPAETTKGPAGMPAVSLGSGDRFALEAFIPGTTISTARPHIAFALGTAPFAASSVRVGQQVVETLSLPFPDLRVTQLVVETLSLVATADVRVTQEYVEALTANATAAVRVTEAYAEALTANATADVRVTEVYVEVLGNSSIYNAPPVVNAGVDQGITLPATATMAATATDDGNPNPPATLTLAWTQQSGPGTATFDDATIEDPVVTFDLAGVYVLRLTATDSALAAYDDVTITVAMPDIDIEVDQYALEYAVNIVPTVYAGPDQAGDILEILELDLATATGFAGSVTYLWTKQSGPGTATWQSTTLLNPWVFFNLTGTYVLRLTATDGALTAYDECTITVSPRVQQGPPVCSDTELVVTWIETTSDVI